MKIFDSTLHAQVVAEFINVIMGFDKTFFKQDLSAAKYRGFDSFGNPSHPNLVNNISDQNVPLLLFHHLTYATIGHDNHLMFKEGNKDHDSGAMTGIEHFFFEKSIFGSLSRSLVHVRLAQEESFEWRKDAGGYGPNQSTYADQKKDGNRIVDGQ